MEVNKPDKNHKINGVDPILIELPDFSPEQSPCEISHAKIHIYLANGWELTGEYTAGELRTVRVTHPSNGGHVNG